MPKLAMGTTAREVGLPPHGPVADDELDVVRISEQVRAKLLMSGVYLRPRTVNLASGLMLKGQTYLRDLGVTDPAVQLRILSPIVAGLMLIQAEERQFRQVIGDDYDAWTQAQVLAAGLIVGVTGWRKWARMSLIVFSVVAFMVCAACYGTVVRNHGPVGNTSLEMASLFALVVGVVGSIMAWWNWPRSTHLAIPVKA